MFLGIFIGLCLVGGLVLAIFVVASASREQKAKERNPGPVLDDVFTDDVVTYAAGGGALTPETVIKGAHERGYALTSRSEVGAGMSALVFTRR